MIQNETNMQISTPMELRRIIPGSPPRGQDFVGLGLNTRSVVLQNQMGEVPPIHRPMVKHPGKTEGGTNREDTRKKCKPRVHESGWTYAPCRPLSLKSTATNPVPTGAYEGACGAMRRTSDPFAPSDAGDLREDRQSFVPVCRKARRRGRKGRALRQCRE